jgi:hypothetical protein
MIIYSYRQTNGFFFFVNVYYFLPPKTLFPSPFSLWHTLIKKNRKTLSTRTIEIKKQTNEE